MKVFRTPIGYSLVAIVTDLCRHLTYDLRGGGVHGEGISRIIIKILPEIHTVGKCDFLNSIIHSTDNENICTLELHRHQLFIIPDKTISELSEAKPNFVIKCD